MAEKRAFVSAVLMAIGASGIFTEDLEDAEEMAELVAQKPQAKLVGGQGLSAKREAWLFLAAQDADLSKDALDRCLEFLRQASNSVVKGFFEDLARRKDVFGPFNRGHA